MTACDFGPVASMEIYMLRQSWLPMCVTPGIVGVYQQCNAWQLAALAAALAGISLT